MPQVLGGQVDDLSLCGGELAERLDVEDPPLAVRTYRIGADELQIGLPRLGMLGQPFARRRRGQPGVQGEQLGERWRQRSLGRVGPFRARTQAKGSRLAQPEQGSAPAAAIERGSPDWFETWPAPLREVVQIQYGKLPLIAVNVQRLLMEARQQ